MDVTLVKKINRLNRSPLPSHFFSMNAAPELMSYSQQLASGLLYIANRGIVLRVSRETLAKISRST